MYIKHILNHELSIFKGSLFPYKKKSVTTLRYEVVVGIGGNIGDVKRRFNHLFYELKRHKQVEMIKTSLILKNPPFGFKEQDDFFNSIIVLKTDMQPNVFLSYLLKVEKKFKRQRSFANAPRTLDLDIIFFDNRVIKSKKLTVPHPFFSQRESVMIPLLSLKR